MPADLDTLLIALHVSAHQVRARRPRALRRPQLTDRRPAPDEDGVALGLGGQIGSTETKPFYLTTEFLVTLMAVIATAIAAATDSEVSSRLALALIAGLVAAYTLSRVGATACTGPMAMA